MEQIPLRFSDPEVVAKTLNGRALPPGVTRVQPDPKAKNTLRVIGTQEGIASVREIVSLIDREPRKGTFRFVVERVRFGASGKRSTTRVGRKTLTLTHNVPVVFKLIDTTGATLLVAATARMPQTNDTPATFLTELGCRQGDGPGLSLKNAAPLPAVSTSKRMIGLTFADESAVVSTVGGGYIPTKWKAPFTAYYLTVETVSLPE
jgi:hypothetical protein